MNMAREGVFGLAYACGVPVEWDTRHMCKPVSAVIVLQPGYAGASTVTFESTGEDPVNPDCPDPAGWTPILTGGPCVTPEPAVVEVSDTMQSWIDSAGTAACRSAVCAVPILCKGRFMRAQVAGVTDNVSVFLAAGGRHTCSVTF